MVVFDAPALPRGRHLGAALLPNALHQHEFDHAEPVFGHFAAEFRLEGTD